MRNPLARLAKRDPAKPTLRQRAAALKATAARVLKRRPPHGPAADPRLVAMVDEWRSTEELINGPELADGPELEAVSERHCELQRAIYAYPCASLADLRAKIAVFRDEQADAVAESLGGEAWAGLFRDIEWLATARGGIELAAPQKVGPSPSIKPSDLALACDRAIAHVGWIDVAAHAEDWDDDRLDAEMDKHGAVFRRAISEPSASLTDLAAKARLVLENFERHAPSVDRRDAQDSLIAVVLNEIIAFDPTARAPAGDTSLLALEAEFRATDDAVSAAYAVRWDAEAAYTRPAMPKELRPWRGDWMHVAIPRARIEPAEDGAYRSLPYDAEQVEQMRGLRCYWPAYGDDGEIVNGRRVRPDTQVQERVDGIVAAWDSWHEAIRMAEEALNLPALREACEIARQARLDVLAQIRAMPALSLVGLGVKARVAAAMNGEDDLKADGLRSYEADEPEAFPFDIAGDVLALTGGGKA